MDSISKDLQVLLVDIFKTKEKIDEFLITPREEWKGLTPNNLILVGKTKGVIDLLEALKYGHEGFGM